MFMSTYSQYRRRIGDTVNNGVAWKTPSCICSCQWCIKSEVFCGNCWTLRRRVAGEARNMTENALSIWIVIFSVHLQQTETSERKLFIFHFGVLPCVCKHSTVTHHWCQHHFRKIYLGMKQQYILEIRRNQEWWILERNKKLRIIIFWNWNNTRTNSFLEIGKSNSNVRNVFKGLSLTGHRIQGYQESRVDIYYIL